jgi:hypothetical protein
MATSLAAWAEGELQANEVQSVGALASELGLSADTTADIEREVMAIVRSRIRLLATAARRLSPTYLRCRTEP